MRKVNWIELLGWKEEQIEDIRLVGYSFAKQGHYTNALKFFEVLVLLDKDDPYDLQMLGSLYLQIGNNISALNYLERALKLNSSHEPTLLNRAKVLFLLGYKRQGITQAKHLQESTNEQIAAQAKALLIAYG